MKLFKYLLILSICFSHSIINAQNPTLTNSMEKKKVDKVFQVVEDAPLFPGCEKVKKAERKTCADSKLFEYLGKELEYPVIARENGISGAVILQFVVEKDGSITDVKVVRGIGGGCDEAATKVVENMPKWNPGKQRGRPVRVQFTLPVRFILQ